nr:hypothetical protein Iba_chr03bCG2700 [Ipomoea batatas]GMC74960.1 hypothetical protein Iba_chr03dCG0550 [Ipomoea batatas]GMD48803.1 hypothetical protein Iba_scaffold1354427CG0010 [Ipomoea batatas]
MVRAHRIDRSLVAFKCILFCTICCIPNLNGLIISTRNHTELLIRMRKCEIIYTTNMSINLYMLAHIIIPMI